MTRIQAIGFDVGGVIFPDLHVPVEDKIAQVLGLPPETAKQVFEEAWERLATGKAAEEELWGKLIEKSDTGVSVEELKRIFRELLIPSQEMVFLIKELAQKHSLFIASNSTRGWLDYELDHFGLRPFFKTIVSSAEVGARKPNPKFFEFLLKKLAYPPKTCLFIDDRENNTQAASGFGFETLVFRNLSNLRDDLLRREIFFGGQRSKEYK